MENLFRKFCHYYITDQSEKYLHELEEEARDEFEEYLEETKKYTDNLKRDLKELGYAIDFESFCNLLEEYINKKDSLDDNTKRVYLKCLMNLSEIYEVNLREELERYTSYKEKTKEEKIDEKDLFYQFCKYNINPNSNVDEYNNLKELATQNNIQFKEVQKRAIMFIEELKLSAEHLGFNLEEDDIDYIVRDYLRKKSKLSDYDKSRYLKVLLYLSEIYGIDLRAKLTSPKEEKTELVTFDINEFLRNLSNPLDNNELLSILLNERYQNGYFDIRDISLKSDIPISDSPNYDKIQYQSELTYKVYKIFIDKYNNYCIEDLNEYYLNLIPEEDIKRLDELTEEDIYNILKAINAHKQPSSICKHHNITPTLYMFIETTTVSTTDISTEHIGIGNNNLFNTDNSKYTIRIYLNGKDEETHQVLNQYILKCIDENINYDMKALGNNSDSLERTILFANINDISKKVQILDEIFEDDKLKQAFTSPVHSTGRINNSVYGISHSGVIDNNLTCVKSYNDYFNNICEVAYYRVISKIILDIIDDEQATIIIKNFINLGNIDFSKAEMKSPELATYSEVSFDTIKDLVNQYIPLITSTLNIYITDDTKKQTLIEEFKKSIRYIFNICEDRDKKFPSNIIINSYLEQFIKNN